MIAVFYIWQGHRGSDHSVIEIPTLERVNLKITTDNFMTFCFFLIISKHIYTIFVLFYYLMLFLGFVQYVNNKYDISYKSKNNSNVINILIRRRSGLI